MESALGWIGDLVAWLVDFLPHLEVIPKTHAGVKFVRGWKVKVLEPGMHWYWPITSDIITAPVVRQSLQLDGQTLTCADGKCIYISMVMVYSIHDIEEALVETWEFDDTIEDIAQKCTASRVAEYDRDYLLSHIDAFSDDLLDWIEDRLTAYGVTLSGVGIVDLAPVKVYRFVTD